MLLPAVSNYKEALDLYEQLCDIEGSVNWDKLGNDS
jgi:hypothetical protein